MSRELLALFAKCPRPGEVKTRLIPELGEAAAASLYKAMLLDIVSQHADETRDLALWFSPADAEPWFAKRMPPGYRLLVQEGPELPLRMRSLFRRHAGEGYERIVLRGTDSATLPRARIDEAFSALAECDLVLCPDLDGGYNLIGLRTPCDDIFDIPMSTGSVLDETLARASGAGLRSRLLEPHHDVDVAADLVRLERGIDPDQAPLTFSWLRDRH